MQGADTIVMIALYGIGGILLLIYVIFILIYLFFVLRLLKNRAEPTKQKYLRGVFNISVINAVFAVISILGGTWISIISLAVNAAIIAGFYMQENYNPPDKEAAEQQ